MLARRKVIAFYLILACAGFANPAMAQGVGPGEPCDGPAIVWPPEDLYGSIYISKTLRNDTVPRVGYLPSGTVVNLEEPRSDSRADFRKNFCGFHFRNTVAGHVDRRHVTKIVKIIRAAGLSDADAVIVSPANPETGLDLYRSRDLASKPVATLARSDRTIVLLSARDLVDGADAIKVRYTADMSSRVPKFAEAYIKIADDRSISFDGTFRLFRPFAPLASADPPPAHPPSSWFDNLATYLSAFIQSGAGLSATIDKLKQYTGMGDCGVSQKVDFELELSVGADIKIIGMAVKGAGSIEWTKPEDKATQFVNFGLGTRLPLIVSGTAQCRGEYPAYLDQAHIIIGDPKSNNGEFVVDRDEVFNQFSEDDVLKGLKDVASLINIRRDKDLGLPQMVVVPSKPAKSPFYYTYFNRLEKFMYNDVFQAPLSIDENDRYALTLLLGEALTYWVAPTIPSYRGHRKTS